MLRLISLLLFVTYPVVSFSSIQILATRVILEGKDNEESFVIKNLGKKPSLVQLWLANKNDNGMDIKNDIPLAITPPVARINAGRKKVFRVFATSDALSFLPQDRESAFWINVLDTPAIEEGAENKLNIAFRTQIKMFYRPVSLKDSLEESAEKLQWSVRKVSGTYTYTVRNNSPYHFSFASLSLKAGDKDVARIPGDMVSPFSSKAFGFENISHRDVFLNYQYINDLGAFVTRIYKKSQRE